jgi:hypothetical protein
MGFIPGLQLSRQFYWQAVRPLLEETAPGLPHAAALIDSGSEVLGFDTEMSSDHHWGPRVLLFLADEDYPAQAARLSAALGEGLPFTFLGYPTNFSPPDPLDSGTRLLQASTRRPIAHRVEIFTPGGFFRHYLGLEVRQPLQVGDWLTLEEQRLRTVAAGEVFHDGLGQLEPLRQGLAWYPQDLWLYLLSAEWAKIGQEEPFVGRCGGVGDEVGSRLVAARLVHSLMRLGFLMEKQYPPYSKWFGTAFARLACAARLQPHLEAALAAPTWPERAAALCRAYEQAAAQHNALGLTPALPEQVSSFHGRPFQVIHGERFADALQEAIADPAVRSLPPYLGSVNSYVASVDVLSSPRLCRRLAGLYEDE